MGRVTVLLLLLSSLAASCAQTLSELSHDFSLSDSARQIVAGCQVGNVCFAIDDSTSVMDAQYASERGFVITTATQIDAGTTGTIYSAVAYAEVLQEPNFVDLADTILETRTADVNLFTTALQARSRPTGTEVRFDAIDVGLTACQNALAGAAGVRTIVLLTTGSDTRQPTGIDVAGPIKAGGTNIITIGIGNGVEATELQTIANSAAFFTPVDSFASLNNAVNPLLVSLCTLGGSAVASPSLPAAAMSSVTSTVTPSPSSDGGFGGDGGGDGGAGGGAAVPSPTSTATAAPVAASPAASSVPSAAASPAGVSPAPTSSSFSSGVGGTGGAPPPSPAPGAPGTPIVVPPGSPATTVSQPPATTVPPPSPATTVSQPPATTVPPPPPATTVPPPPAPGADACTYAFSRCPLTFLDSSDKPYAGLQTFEVGPDGRFVTPGLVHKDGKYPGRLRGRVPRVAVVLDDGKEIRLTKLGIRPRVRGSPFVARGRSVYFVTVRGYGKVIIKKLGGACIKISFRFLIKVSRPAPHRHGRFRRRRTRIVVVSKCAVFRVGGDA